MKPIQTVICDIDGTAANIDHRRHWVEDKSQKVNWKAFFGGMTKDTPNAWCQKLLESLSQNGIKIVFVSGRPSDYETITRQWLDKHYSGIKYDLYMRQAGDFRQDYLVKEEIYDKYLNNYQQPVNILFVVDDRKQVVDMWRSKGLVVLQCDEGNF